MAQDFKEEFSKELRRKGVSEKVENPEVESADGYSVLSWTIHDSDLGKDVIFRIKVDDETDEIVERIWAEAGEGGRVLRYENKELENQLLKSAKKFIN